VISRYTLAGRGGDIFWNPEHDPDYKGSQHGWINFASLRESTAAGLLAAARAAVLVLLAGAIGWRRADRGGPQRALHYALVLAAMMLINQRTWDHHTAVLLPAYVAVWYAVYRAPLGRGARAAAGTATAAAMALVYLTRADVIGGVARLVGAAKAQAKVLADYVEAYGPGFWQLVMVLVVAAGLLIGWRLAERRGGERAAP